MKPDWKDAPEWANWLAKDSDGCWYWFAKKPVWSEYNCCYLNKGTSKWAFAGEEAVIEGEIEGRP